MCVDCLTIIDLRLIRRPDGLNSFLMVASMILDCHFCVYGVTVTPSIRRHGSTESSKPGARADSLG